MKKIFAICLLAALWCLCLPLTSAETMGAEYTGSGVQFSLYSENATRVELWLFGNPDTATPNKTVVMQKEGNVWKTFVAGLAPGAYYGYRVWGPNWPYDPSWKPGSEAGFIQDVDSQGNRFNPNKLLLDPYAKCLSHDPKGGGYLTGAKERKLDTAAGMSKGVVVASDFSWDGDEPLRKGWEGTIIYEVHLRGLTRSSSSGVSHAGTYRGVAEKAAYLKELGVTAVEFLPVQETINDQNDNSNPGDDNYWGYMTINYCAPDRRYSSDQSPEGPVREFKEMVKTLHSHGIEVILDVVYNHTAEGGTAGDSKSACLFTFRGIDNQVYYQLTRDNQYYWDNTGCGANLHVTHAQTRKFVVDSLKYWVNEMHVDGFRFDLASVLGNTVDKHGFQFSSNAPLLCEIVQAMPGTKMIAEPWACGDGTYQVGNFPQGWGEWNGKFRDTARKFVLMEAYTIGEMATRLCGSSDLYQDDGRKPYHSINFIVAHDGFTLYDLTSYNQKNNGMAYPYGPSDGGEDNNCSRDWGSEPLKKQQIRNFACFMLLSQGTPMLLGGDEFARTQRGNNNAYNLDTVCSWLDFSLQNNNNRLWKFFQGLIDFRKRCGAFQRSSFFSGRDNDGDQVPDVQWHGCGYKAPDWSANSRALAMRIDGSKEETGAASSHGDIYIAINSWQSGVTFELPPNHPGKKWYRVIDTAAWAENNATIQNNIEKPGEEDGISDGSWSDLGAGYFAGNNSYRYEVNGHALVVFIEK